MYKNIQIFAEVKTASPFGFASKKSWDELFAVAEKVGDALSIHTDPRWGGSYALLEKARKKTRKPLLAKGIHQTDKDVRRAVECGADMVLVVGRIPGVYQERCLIEPNTLDELREVPFWAKVVWNARDLLTGERKPESLAQAREVWAGWLCQASFIRTVADVALDVDAVLVGSDLEGFLRSLSQKRPL